MRQIFVQGNEACGLGAIAAGAKFFAGYPITPASELAEFCSKEMPKVGGYYFQMEDELASIAAVIGASLGGLRSFTATSGPGMSLMQENLGFAILAEVPCVIINVQRFGPSTGVATRPGQADIMQARWGTHGDHTIIALAPASVQECYDLTIEAFNLAERFSTPVILLSDGALAHLREKISVYDDGELEITPRSAPEIEPEKYLPYRPNEKGVPHLSPYGNRHILRVTSLIHDEKGYSTANPTTARCQLERLETKITGYQEELPQAKCYGSKNPDAVVISFGISARAARQAVHFLNNDNFEIGMMDLKTIWPFPEKNIQEYCSQAEKVFVVEMNRGQLTGEVERILPGLEVIPVLRADTQVISPQEIIEKIKEVLR